MGRCRRSEQGVHWCLNMRARLFHLTLLLVLGTKVVGATPFEEGERLYAENKPGQAKILLEEALLTEPQNPKIYHYLGIVYEQLGEHDRAIQIMQRGLPIAGELKPEFYHNMGQNFVARDEFTLAQEMFTEAIDLRSSFAEPYLNRANSRVNLKEFQGAIVDYTMYLRLKPSTPRRSDVEKMIALLTGRLDQLDADARARADAERDLLNQVLNALQNASEDAQNLSTRSEDVLEEDEDEIDIKE